MQIKVNPQKFADSKYEPSIKNLALSVSVVADDDYTLPFTHFKTELDRHKLDINNRHIQSMFFSCENNIDIRLNPKFIKACGIQVKKPKKEYFYLSDISEIHRMLVAYNRVRNVFYFNKGRPHGVVAPLESTPMRMKDCDNLIQFLKPLQVEDYYLYFYTIFAATSWGAVWSFKKCMSPKALDYFHSYKDRCNEELTRESLAITAQNEQKNPWFDVFPHIEDKKQRLVNKGYAEVCMSRPDEFLGFHPKSSVCANCPLKGGCAQNVFLHYQNITNSKDDILAIRANTILSGV